MTLEEQLFNVLQSLVAGRVFPDIAPADTPRPYLTYQAVGGQPINFIGSEIPDKENTRAQVNVWADTRLAASALGKQVEDALRTAPGLQTEVASGRVATYDETTTYRGTMQDFSFLT